MTARTRSRLFMSRSQKIHWNTTRRARDAGAHLDYTLEDFRQLVERGCEEGCPYCERPLTAANFYLDHSVPTSRGGCFGLHNLEITSKRCKGIKRVLEGSEFL